MKVITAPHLYIPKNDEITVFLAGGITGCYNWQKEVIDELYRIAPKDDDRIVIYNPRRADFDVNDPFATNDQITWEFQYLNDVDIFSMYFVGGDQIQPICLYELGRYLNNRWMLRVVSVETGYKRSQDVVIQTHLASEGLVHVDVEASPAKHAARILEAIKSSKYNSFSFQPRKYM